MEFPSNNDRQLKLGSSVSLTMDYDSGYMSHNPESNLDSSLESNTVEGSLKSETNKPIYLSEDALLEKPDLKHNYSNLSLEIENENYEETRNLFYSLGNDNSDTILSNSVASQGTSYSCFGDSEVENDISPIIPQAKPIVVDVASLRNTVNIYSDERDDNFHTVPEVENSFSGKLDKPEVKSKLQSALSNITNTLDTNESSKKLTLIFSKVDKENVYSVKRKFQSLSPEQETSGISNVDSSLEESYISEKNSSRENVSLTTETESAVSLELDNSDAEGDVKNPCNDEKDFSFTEDRKPASIDASDSNNDLYILLKRENIGNDYENGDSLLISESMLQDVSKISHLAQEETTLNKTESSQLPDEEKPSFTETDCTSTSIVNTVIKEELAENKNFVHLCEATTDINSRTTDVKESTDSKDRGQLDENSQSLSHISEIVVNNNFEIPEIINISATPVKTFQNPVDPNISPDLFGEDDAAELPAENIRASAVAAEKYIIGKDRILVKKAYNSLKGVLPPHSMTTVHMSVDEMLNKIEANQTYFWSKEPEVSSNETVSSASHSSKSLLVSEPLGVVEETKWPTVLEGRALGVHFNRSKLSEQFEELCSKYAQRYVGAETQSSCTVFEIVNSSPMKRKQIKQRWNLKSPGRRLSHLARRRITFSSANLQASSSFAGSRARQILVDAKKLDLLKRRSPRKSPRKTPKKTPSKSPRIKTRTPSSSAKKKLAMRFRKVSGEIETTATTNSNSRVMSSKRALFLSPDRDKTSLFAPSTSGVSTFEKEVKKPLKRALFLSPSKKSPLKHSPFKRSPFKHLDLGDKKRKRSESDESRPAKLARTVSEVLKPSESELKTLGRHKITPQISSSQGQLGELSAAHKKKLQWAVYEALRSQEITPSHPQFKVFASILARVTRRLLPYLTGGFTAKEMGTSEKMLRITRHHIYAVMKGKSVDEIVNEYLRNRARHSKPQGYIGIEEFNSAKKNENVLQDRSNVLATLEKKKVDLDKPKAASSIDRIRKVINFGDDDNS